MPVDLQGKRDEVQDQLLEASRMIENMKSSISCSDSAEKEVEEVPIKYLVYLILLRRVI